MGARVAANSPPSPRVSCAYIILFGSGLAGLGTAVTLAAAGRSSGVTTAMT